MGKKSKTSVEPSKMAKPYITGAANALQSTYDANQAGTQQLASTMNGYLSKMGDKAFGENPTLAAAQGYANDVLGGKYLNGNQYLNDMVALNRGNTSDAVKAQFAKAGMSFGTDHGKALTDELSKAELGLRYQDYGSERDRMGQMAGLSPALVAAEYAPMEAYGNLAGQAAELPYIGAKTLASGMGGLMGNYTTQTQKQGAGTMLGSLLGSGLAGWASGGFSIAGGKK